MSRIAVLGIIIESGNKTEEVNSILSNYGNYIVGRMGIPYREKGINIISVVFDAPNQVISAVSGKIGKLDGVQVKALYSMEFPDE